MSKQASLTAVGLVLATTFLSTVTVGTPKVSASVGRSEAPLSGTASDWIFPTGNARIEPTFAQGNANGFYISQMFNDSCDPALGQGYYYAGEYFCGHTGVDLADNHEGDPIVSTANGVVIEAQYNSNYGEIVRIQHSLPDGSLVYSQYQHMESGSLMVVAGQSVAMGQQIGRIGSTGFATGPHLHFEIKTVNEDGPGYTFGNAALLIGYSDPLAWIVARTSSLLPTPTSTLTATVPATSTAAITSVPLAIATVTGTLPISVTAISSDIFGHAQSYLTVSGDKVNVRSGSGFTYSPINSVHAGMKLADLGPSGNGWRKVALPNNVVGYVGRQWVSGGILPALPAPSVSGPLKPPFDVVKNDLYPARESPRMSGVPLEPLSVGEQVTYLGTNVSWDKVVLPSGRIGYILNWYLQKPTVRINLALRSMISTVGDVPPVGSTHLSTRRQLHPVTDSSTLPVMTVNVRGANLRQMPRLGSTIEETLPHGMKLRVVGLHVSWAHVLAPDGRSGFVLRRLLSQPTQSSTFQQVSGALRHVFAPPHYSGSTSVRAFTSVLVNVVTANVRVTPTTQSTIMGSFHLGTRLSVVARHGEWLQVSFGRINGGWILSSLTR